MSENPRDATVAPATGRADAGTEDLSPDALQKLFEDITENLVYEHGTGSPFKSGAEWTSWNRLRELIRSSPVAARWAITRLADAGLTPEKRKFLEESLQNGNAEASEAALKAVLDLGPTLASVDVRVSLLRAAQSMTRGACALLAAIRDGLLHWWNNDSNESVRLLLVPVICNGAQSDPEVRQFLLDQLRSPLSPNLRGEIATWLFPRVSEKDPFGKSVIEEAIRIVVSRDESLVLRQELLWDLDRFKDSPSFQPGGASYNALVPEAVRLAQTASQDRVAGGLRVAAIHFLGVAGYPSAPQILLDTIRNDPDPFDRRLAFHQIEYFAPSAALAGVLLELDGALPPQVHPSWYAQMLGLRGDERALPILQRLARDADYYTSDAATKAIAEIHARQHK